MSNLDEHINNYFNLVKKLKEYQIQQKEIKQTIKEEESYFKEYLENNNMTSIASTSGEIFLHEKKSNKGLNKENITSVLRQKISNENIINDVTDSLFVSKSEIIIKSKLK